MVPVAARNWFSPGALPIGSVKSMEVIKHTLSNAIVTLEPLAEDHREDLRAAAADPCIGQFLPFGRGFDSWFEMALAAHAGADCVFAVRAADGALVGSTRYLSIESRHRRLEVGHTWYSREVWGTAVNPSCKFLLFREAFENFGANRVELKCDARNLRSRAAIAKLGAVQEGILRHHMIMEDGYVRDSVLFSITRAEWPAIRERLLRRL